MISALVLWAIAITAVYCGIFFAFGGDATSTLICACMAMVFGALALTARDKP